MLTALQNALPIRPKTKRKKVSARVRILLAIQWQNVVKYNARVACATAVVRSVKPTTRCKPDLNQLNKERVWTTLLSSTIR